MGLDFSISNLYEKYIDETSIMVVTTVHKLIEFEIIEVLNACVISRKFPIYRQEMDDYVIINASVKKKDRRMLEKMFTAFEHTNIIYNEKTCQACLGTNFCSAFNNKDTKGEPCQ